MPRVPLGERKTPLFPAAPALNTVEGWRCRNQALPEIDKLKAPLKVCTEAVFLEECRVFHCCTMVLRAGAAGNSGVLRSLRGTLGKLGGFLQTGTVSQQFAAGNPLGRLFIDKVNNLPLAPGQRSVYTSIQCIICQAELPLQIAAKQRQFAGIQPDR